MKRSLNKSPVGGGAIVSIVERLFFRVYSRVITFIFWTLRAFGVFSLSLTDLIDLQKNRRPGGLVVPLRQLTTSKVASSILSDRVFLQL